MKNYYIKQKIFSIGDKYKVFDENNEICFFVKSQVFALASKLRVYDYKTNEELYFIKRKMFTFLPKYLITKNNMTVATVKKNFTFLTHALTVTTDFGDLEIKGDLFGFTFSIYLNGDVVCEVSKSWFSLSDCYQISCHDETRSDFYVTLTILIDNCIHNEHTNSNN